MEGPLNTLPCLQSIFDPIMPACRFNFILIMVSDNKKIYNLSLKIRRMTALLGIQFLLKFHRILNHPRTLLWVIVWLIGEGIYFFKFWFHFWLCKQFRIDSLDVVETVIELGEYEFTPIPFTIDTELISHNDDVSSLVIRKPFVIRFTLQNFSDEVISLHIIFDPSDVFVFAGSKEVLWFGLVQ